jgi:hypothetical protein
LGILTTNRLARFVRACILKRSKYDGTFSNGKMTTTESQIEEQLIEKLKSLKYEYRPDIAGTQARR